MSDFNLDTLLKIVIPIIAICISIYTLLVTNRNQRRQIKVSKLEEILEILEFFKFHYGTILYFVKYLKRIQKYEYEDSPNQAYSIQEYEQQFDMFISVIGKNTIEDKIARLQTLSKCYLPNKDYSIFNKPVKIRLLTFVDLLRNIAYFTVDKIYAFEKFYPEGYPEHSELRKYIINLEADVINEMRLGKKYQALSEQEIINYRNTTFKTDTGIIKP